MCGTIVHPSNFNRICLSHVALISFENFISNQKPIDNESHIIKWSLVLYPSNVGILSNKRFTERGDYSITLNASAGSTKKREEDKNARKPTSATDWPKEERRLWGGLSWVWREREEGCGYEIWGLGRRERGGFWGSFEKREEMWRRAILFCPSDQSPLCLRFQLMDNPFISSFVIRICLRYGTEYLYVSCSGLGQWLSFEMD